MLALPSCTMHNRDAIGFGVGMKAPAEAAGKTHQVGVVQRLLRAAQGPPPHPKTTGSMPHPEISIQYDPVHAIVADGQEFRISVAQRVRHGSQQNTRWPLAAIFRGGGRRGHERAGPSGRSAPAKGVDALLAWTFFGWGG